MKDGIAKVKSEIKGVMGMMQNNISKVLDRGAKLEDLQDKSEDLEMSASHFRAGSRRLQRKLWWQNFRFKLILAFIFIVILIIIIVPIVLKNKKQSWATLEFKCGIMPQWFEVYVLLFDNWCWSYKTLWVLVSVINSTTWMFNVKTAADFRIIIGHTYRWM